MKRYAPVIATVAVLATSAAWLAFAKDGAEAAQPGGPQEPSPANVEVQTAVGATTPAVALVPGTVVSRNDARIAAEVGGTLDMVAEVGAEIAAGGVLARLDQAELKLTLAEQEGRLARLSSAAKLAEQQYERQRSLSEQGLVSGTQLEEAQARRDMAAHERTEAKVARDRAAHRLERSVVRAPFAGRVVERLRQPGESLAIGGELLRLVDTRRIEVRAQAPLAVAAFVQGGEIVTVNTDYGANTGRIRTVIPVGDDRSRMIEVRIEILPGTSASKGARDARWPIGLAVRVALPQSAPRDVVLVDRDALVVREDGIFVFRVGADNKAERVEVTTGVEQGSQVEITAGIAVGERIVVRGAEALAPGQTVAIQT